MNPKISNLENRVLYFSFSPQMESLKIQPQAETTQSQADDKSVVEKVRGEVERGKEALHQRFANRIKELNSKLDAELENSLLILDSSNYANNEAFRESQISAAYTISEAADVLNERGESAANNSTQAEIASEKALDLHKKAELAQTNLEASADKVEEISQELADIGNEIILKSPDLDESKFSKNPRLDVTNNGEITLTDAGEKAATKTYVVDKHFRVLA
jgi:hypothetical protein